MRPAYRTALAVAALVALSVAAQARPLKLLRFPDIWNDRVVFSYAGDLWTTADENGQWIIEGHGVDTDIVVEQDPVEVLNGHDPQLDVEWRNS
jgi:hypothetical protein